MKIFKPEVKIPYEKIQAIETIVNMPEYTAIDELFENQLKNVAIILTGHTLKDSLTKYNYYLGYYHACILLKKMPEQTLKQYNEQILKDQ